jgi:hypothetical protein
MSLGTSAVGWGIVEEATRLSNGLFVESQYLECENGKILELAAAWARVGRM